MSKQEILERLKAILRDVAGVHGKISPTTKLKVYLPTLYAFAFAVEVHNEFDKTNLTDLANSLYDPIVNLNDLTDYIYGTYNP